MTKLATALLAAPLSIGLALAQDNGATQTPTPQNQPGQTSTYNDRAATNPGSTGQSFTGILVDANCSMASMPKTTPANSFTTTGSADRSSSNMPRSTGSAASSAGAAANSDLNNTAAARDRARDVNQPPDVDSNLDRTTPATAGRTTPGVNSTDNSARQTAGIGQSRTEQSMDTSRSTGSPTTTNSTRDMSQRTTDMAQRTTPTGSAAGPDTQSGNNHSGTADRSASRSNQSDVTGEMTSNTNYGNWDRTCFISPSSTSFVLQLQDGRTVRLDDASNQMVTNRLQSTGRVQSTNKIFRVRVHGTMDGDVLHVTDIQI